MSAASTLLASGFTTLLNQHGEPFSYVPASDVIVAEWGEAVSTEDGAAIPGGNVEAVSVSLIFDGQYLLIDPSGAGQSSTAPVARGRESDLSGIRKNALLTRDLDGQVYVVQSIEPDGIEDGTQRLILSKQVH